MTLKPKKKLPVSLSTTQIILLSFLATILLGSILLSLPISGAGGRSVPYIDALFTATTATCVTGLVTVSTFSAWSLFGQIVILILIQIGGLGIITIMSGLMLLLNRKMGVSDRLLIQDAFNLNTLSGLSVFVRNVLCGTLLIEAVGALLCMPVLVPAFGGRGIWMAVFHSVSAFCNAGMDIMGETSLCAYATHPLINLTTSLLIVLGGIGYIVWWDVLRVIRTRTRQNRKIFRYLTLHSKVAITATLGLIFGGALLIFLFEYRNPLTIGELSLFDKIQVSLFQSVTTRTAGYVSVPQENLTDASAIVSMLLMFIGGSPVGTAGGVKTVTVVALLCSARATVRNRNSTTLFNRKLSNDSIRKALAVVAVFSVVLFASAILLAASLEAASVEASALDVLYESVSATATVGLSRSLTPRLPLLGKLVIIATMYFGRVGPISLAVALGRKAENQNAVSEPVEYMSMG